MAYAWKLMALTMLSSGCVVLRGCDDSADGGGAAAGGAASGGGGAGAGGAGGEPAGGAATGGGGAAAGGAATGGGGAGGGSTVCQGPADCEGAMCVAGVCQGAAFATVSVGIDIPLIGVGGNQVAFLIQAGSTSNPLVCSLAQTEGDVPTCPGGGCVCAFADNPPYWGPGLGTHLAVSPTGASYYSPQAANTSNPVFKCAAGVCAPGPFVPGPPEHLNGLTFIDDELWGVKPKSGQLVRFPAPQGELGVAMIEGSLKGPLGHDLAASLSVSGMLAASTYGNATNLGSVFLIPDLAATPLAVARVSETENIVGLVLPGELPFFRVWDQTNAVHKTYRVGAPPQDGMPQPPIEVYASPAIIIDGGPALAADANFLYFFGQGSSNGVRLLRCPVESRTYTAEECQAVSADLSEPGPIAVSANYVFFASGETLYRAVK